MLKLLLSVVSFFILSNSFAAFPVAQSTVNKRVVPGETATLTPLENMTVKDYEKLTGRKLSFLQRLLFKMEKKYVIKKFKEGDEPTEFKLLPFLLGLLYGPFGLLAVIIFSKNFDARRSAYLGFKIWVGVLLILLLILLAIAGGKFK